MVFTTRTPVNGSGYCSSSSMFGPTVTRTPVGGSCYSRPSFGGFGSSFGSGFGGSWCRPVTRSPVWGSGYYGNSLFGSSSYCYPSYTCMPSYNYSHCARPLNGGAAAIAGLVTGLAVFAALA